MNGSLYSNGDIISSNGAYINGDAYVAGEDGLISNMDIGVNGTGDAHAYQVIDSKVEGFLYCQIGTNNTGVNNVPKSCDTSETAPIAKKLPIPDELIAKWKTDAAVYETSGNVTISTPTIIGPRKIIGNLTINNTLTVQDTIYVTGNIIINEGEMVKLHPSYGPTSGIIIADGYILVDNGVELKDSGTYGSYMLLLSESTCDASSTGSPCNGKSAIEIRNNSSISIINAQKGTVYFSRNVRVKEAVGNKIELANNVNIDYGSGVINVDFTSGPLGEWRIDSWKESE